MSDNVNLTQTFYRWIKNNIKLLSNIFSLLLIEIPAGSSDPNRLK